LGESCQDAAVLVCTLGDLLLDVVVRLEAPLSPGDDAPATTRAGAGGQAANVAAWAASLGAEALLIAKRGDDAAGQVCAAEIDGRGVEVVGPVGDRTGVVVSLVAATGERTMCSDRGAAPELRPEELDPAWLTGCDVLHVSGYALMREPAASAAERACRLVREAGGRISVDLSSAAAIRAAGPDQVGARLERLAPELAFATEAERDALGGGLATKWVVKLGARGLQVDGRVLEAVPVSVTDTTGAGDALAAGFLVGGPELALQAAARCVSKLGSMP
jgi:sugar/nucleoside kinase (ribokinase family)